MPPRSGSDREGRRGHRATTKRHEERGPMKLPRWAFGLAALTVAVLVAGCGQREAADKPQEPASEADKQAAREKKIEAARAKLSAEDRVLVEEQDYCAVR